MPDERTSDEKVADYRRKYPDRVTALNGIVLRLMQPQFAAKLSDDTLAEMAKPAVDAIICAAWGLDA